MQLLENVLGGLGSLVVRTYRSFIPAPQPKKKVRSKDRLSSGERRRINLSEEYTNTLNSVLRGYNQIRTQYAPFDRMRVQRKVHQELDTLLMGLEAEVQFHGTKHTINVTFVPEKPEEYLTEDIGRAYAIPRRDGTFSLAYHGRDGPKMRRIELAKVESLQIGEVTDYPKRKEVADYLLAKITEKLQEYKRELRRYQIPKAYRSRGFVSRTPTVEIDVHAPNHPDIRTYAEP